MLIIHLLYASLNNYNKQINKQTKIALFDKSYMTAVYKRNTYITRHSLT